MNIRRNMGVLKALVKLRFQNLMMFRLGFFGPFFVDGSLFVVQLLVFGAVYANVDSIGSWQRGEMILYIGTFSLLNAINMVVYFFGINDLQRKIRSGDLDLYLTKPVSPLFRITFERINPGSIPLVIMSVLIILYGIKEAGVSVTSGSVFLYLGWVLVMAVLYYDLEVIIRSLTFYFVSTSRMDQLEEAGLSLCMQLPGIAFYGIYKVIFYCVLPYGIMATFPVQSIIGEMTALQAVFGIGIIVLFSIVTAVIWKCGVKRYHSASS